VENAEQQLSTLREETQEKEATIERLTGEITQLQQQIAAHSSPRAEIKEVEKFVVPPEVKAQVESLQQRLRDLTQQRDTLAGQAAQLGEEARATAQKRGEEEQERRIRLNWYRVTGEFQTSVVKILSQWPSPLDTLAFEADDWARLSQTKEVAQRFLAECAALTQRKVVDSTPISAKEGTR
jgi:chromosome segregation ATPase